MSYQFLPDLSDDDYEALKADIGARGVLVPVEYDEAGTILDGHHRVRACEELGIANWPKITRSFDTENEKRTHARQINLARRHLNQQQRRDLIADDLRDRPERSNRRVAADLGVDHKTVGTVRDALAGTGEIPQLETTVGDDGKARPAKRPKITGIDLGEEGARATTAAAKEIRAERASEKRAERIDKIAEISKGNADLDVSRRYPIIYADPPWRYENPPMGGSNRSIENHYPTMTLDEICALPVRDLAHADALLYLWATAPKLAECMSVIEAWGFEYRTNFVWVKDKIGMGYHARNQHEILLVAKCGQIPPPAVEHRVSSVVHGSRTEHSAKPDRFYEIIEAAYPELAKIELFSRRPREGWAAWGNQAEAA